MYMIIDMVLNAQEFISLTAICAINIAGVNRKNRSRSKYPKLQSKIILLLNIKKFGYVPLKIFYTLVREFPEVIMKLKRTRWL
jgi:hypothetical protein